MAAVPEEINELLHRIAERFEEAVQTIPEDASHQGWGQFLDAPKLHQQVGIYGTCAGVIVLALAGRKQSSLAQKTAETLVNWWNQRNAADYERKRFAQTLRVAFLHFASRLSPVLSQQQDTADIKQELLDRLLPSHSWGNYWLNANDHDPTPRPFVTAVVLLSFTLFAPPEALAPQLLEVADTLERTLLGSDARPLYEQIALGAAILSVKGASTASKAISTISELARALPQAFADQAVYFYDYEHPPQSKKKSRYGRDYLIISPELFLGIAGFQPGAPASLRLRAESVVDSLVSHCKSHQQAFRPAPSERLSTMNQAWCAILLALFSAAKGSPTRCARIRYMLVRSRTDNSITRVIMPLFAVAIVTVGNVLVDDSPLHRAVAALCLLLITSMYGRRMFNKGLAPLIGARHDNV